jgi:hypothetical protein
MEPWDAGCQCILSGGITADSDEPGRGCAHSESPLRPAAREGGALLQRLDSAEPTRALLLLLP